jgi:hypothetical protein
MQWLRVNRRRFVLIVLGLFAVGVTALAIADRKAAYMTLYGAGALLLVLGSAAGFGGGAAGALPGGHSSEMAKVHRSDMRQRLGWASGSYLFLIAGVLMIALGFLLNVA